MFIEFRGLVEVQHVFLFFLFASPTRSWQFHNPKTRFGFRQIWVVFEKSQQDVLWLPRFLRSIGHSFCETANAENVQTNVLKLVRDCVVSLFRHTTSWHTQFAGFLKYLWCIVNLVVQEISVCFFLQRAWWCTGDYDDGLTWFVILLCDSQYMSVSMKLNSETTGPLKLFFGQLSCNCSPLNSNTPGKLLFWGPP